MSMKNAMANAWYDYCRTMKAEITRRLEETRHLSNLVVADHPLIVHKLSLMRDKGTSSMQFRHLLREASLLLGYELLRDLPTELRDIETPVGPARVPFLKGKKLVLVPILRAGNGLLEGLLELVPAARVGHIGLYRSPKTLEAVEYYCKLPDDIATRLAIVVAPMLATGHSAVAAITRLKEHGARDVRLVCLLAAPEGIAELARVHPSVPVFTGAVDAHLNDHGYIVPGLGDAGDRMYGMK
jgi:uracil phosphoribosyltransferase